jgi:hypothetical protein
MTKADILEREIELLDKEIRKFEQLNLTSDKFYICLQMEKYSKIAQLEYCIENNL